MISVAEAEALVMQHCVLQPAELCPLTEATGRVLREDLIADRDFPPFNRITMDGIALRYAAWDEGLRRFELTAVEAAGMPQTKLDDEHAAIEVMTGAVLPEGCDTVICVEDVSIETEGSRKFAVARESGAKKKFQFVHLQGSDRKAGDVLARQGAMMSAAEIAVAASVGKSPVLVSRVPRVAVVTTGDELAEVNAVPQPHEIRRTNGYAIHSLLSACRIPATLFHVRDNEDELRLKFSELLAAFDVLIISGGVSMGKKDYVPEMLTQVGVKKIFHGVKQRPGKPMWFGQSTEGKTVFALPGNPVSVMLCAVRYAVPWLLKSTGFETSAPLLARLVSDVCFASPLTYFPPVNISFGSDAVISATPYESNTSGDFAGLLACDGFLEIPESQPVFSAGAVFPLWLFRPLFSS
ncbi:MAG: molybdopterin molybdotransferase MoeA [Rhizobacter sp.]|nr:molybdopterin molybdotransferase MoeA [Chlorobiales bacterium]